MEVLPEIHQHVDEDVAYRARGGERAGVVSPRPDSSTTTESAVHGARESDREAADATGQRVSVFRFRDQMDVVVLDTEFDEAEVVA